MSESLQEIFIQEVDDNIAFLESALFDLEAEPENYQLINDIFRSMHSIKGGAGLAGFNSIKDFTHKVEDLMEKIRSREIAVSEDIITLLFNSLDVIKAIAENLKAHREPLAEIDSNNITSKIDSYLDKSSEETIDVGHLVITEHDDYLYYINLEYYDSIFMSGIDPLMFFKDLSQAGEILYLFTDTADLPSLKEYSPEVNYLKWKLFYKSSIDSAQLEDIFCFVIDESSIEIKVLNPLLDNPIELNKFEIEGHTLIDIYPELFTKLEKVSDPVVETSSSVINSVSSLPESAPLNEKKAQNLNKSNESSSAASLQSESYIRVKTGKLETIFNTVGELLINQSRLNMLVEDHDDEIDEAFFNVADSLKNITSILQEQITGLRMINLEGTFNKYRRVVRDLSKSRNKSISLEIEGKNTELDKNMIEKLDDPIKHIIRNCIDHGIEDEQERLAAGKEAEGHMRLAAYLEGGKVIIQISDDGRGISRQKLLIKARENNLIAEDSNLSDQEILNLIFHPGLSTAEEITDISGRGVGMDVVKSTLNELHGSISVESIEGAGTTFRLYLPLTLAILDGMLIEVGKEKYILPTLMILEIFRPVSNQIKTISSKGEVVKFRNEYVPIIRLHKLFGLTDAIETPEEAELIVVVDGDKKAAFLVDIVQDQYQVVLKSLQRNYKKVKFISSATILGNGDVALILDIQSIVQYTLKEKQCVKSSV